MENFDRFVTEVAAQAEKIQSEQEGTHENYQLVNRESKYRVKKALHVIRRSIRKYMIEYQMNASRERIDKSHNDARGQKRRRDSYEALLCLIPGCKAKGRRNYINSCEILGKNTKTTLLKEYRRTKKVRLENV